MYHKYYGATKKHDHKMYAYSNMECGRNNFCHLGSFLPFDPPKNPKTQNFEKILKTPEDSIILH